MHVCSRDVRLAAASFALLLCVPFTTALAAPTLSVDTSPMNFSPPSFMVGTSSPEVLRLVGNSGSDPLAFASQITGANPGDFTLGACSQATVVPGATWCKVQIGFRPTATGTRTAILELKTNDPAAAKVQIPLNGSATVAAPRVAANPTSLAFGTQPVGVASATQRITISNSGTVLLTITNVASSNPEFSVVTDCMVAPLGAHNSSVCAADVTFTPSAGGPRQAVLTVISDDPRGPFTVPITGTGAAPAVSVSPTSINFGSAFVGSSASPRQVVFTNTGSAVLNVSAPSFGGANFADFTASGSPCTVPVGGSCTVTLSFFANAFGSRNGQASFTTNALGGQPVSVTLSGFGEITTVSPPPLPADDHHFVTVLPTGTCRSNGQTLSAAVPVSRVIGSLGPSAAVAAGTLLPSATLEIMALDSSATAVHSIAVNNTTVATLPTAPGSWTLRTVTFPVTLLSFPAQAPIGSAPTPVTNTIVINPDTTKVGGCVAVAWVRLSFKAMSPVIMIHGNGSDGGFFVRQGFAGALTAAGIANDSSINLTGLPGGAATIATNASTLQCLVPPVVRSFGVNSVHVVAHSKGGLDTRLWLSLFASTNLTARPPAASCMPPAGTVNPAFSVISLTTLSTPHLGSALADLSVAADASGVALYGFSLGTASSLGLSATDAAIPNLTTFFTAGFNPPLPAAADYRMLGGDTDLNGDGIIVNAPVDEYLAARGEPPPPPPSTLAAIFASPPVTVGGTTITGPQMADALVTMIHGILSNVSTFTVGFTTVIIPTPLFPVVVTITHPVPIPTAAPAPNDLLVTIGSANGGPSPFVSAVAPLTFTLAAGRNHASIANAGVAGFVIPLLITTDLTRGDLK